MEVNVRKEDKIVEVWLTRAESKDVALQKSLDPYYKLFKEHGYTVAVFHSGKGDLIAGTAELLRQNMRDVARAVARNEQDALEYQKRRSSMAGAKTNLEWYVFTYNSNAKQIEHYNVFLHVSFLKDVKELLKKELNREAFSEGVRKSAMYYFWSKCEHEVIVSDMFSGNKCQKKVDAYEQLRMNWEVFIDYILQKAPERTRK